MPGPYLAVAVLCEKVLQEQDGVLSAVRIVDQLTQGAIGPEVPDDMPGLLINLTALIVLKAGDARGRFAVRLRPELPSGQQMPPAEFAVRFDGASNQGQALIMPLNLEVEEEGLYWFDVLFVAQRGGDDQLLSRIPLLVSYRPQRTTPQG